MRKADVAQRLTSLRRELLERRDAVGLALVAAEAEEAGSFGTESATHSDRAAAIVATRWTLDRKHGGKWAAEIERHLTDSLCGDDRRDRQSDGASALAEVVQRSGTGDERGGRGGHLPHPTDEVLLEPRLVLRVDPEATAIADRHAGRVGAEDDNRGRRGAAGGGSRRGDSRVYAVLELGAEQIVRAFPSEMAEDLSRARVHHLQPDRGVPLESAQACPSEGSHTCVQHHPGQPES